MTTGLEVCSDCDQELEHCHGTAIVAEDGSYACSDDPDCRMAIDLHLFIANADS
jgi:hypothetical protein